MIYIYICLFEYTNSCTIACCLSIHINTRIDFLEARLILLDYEKQYTTAKGCMAITDDFSVYFLNASHFIELF